MGLLSEKTVWWECVAGTSACTPCGQRCPCTTLLLCHVSLSPVQVYLVLCRACVAAAEATSLRVPPSQVPCCPGTGGNAGLVHCNFSICGVF